MHKYELNWVTQPEPEGEAKEIGAGEKEWASLTKWTRQMEKEEKLEPVVSVRQSTSMWFWMWFLIVLLTFAWKHIEFGYAMWKGCHRQFPI